MASADENSAGGRTIESDEAKREANQLIDSRRWHTQVESLDNYDFLLEQSDVSSVMAGMKLLDREIVDANELDAAIDEILSAIRCQVGIVRFELRTADKRRVSSSKKYALVGPYVLLSEIGSADGHQIIRKCEKNRGADESLNGNAVDSFAIVEEMFCGIDVRSGVRSKSDRRHVCA